MLFRCYGASLPGTAWTWHSDIRGEHGDNCEAQCVPGVRKKPHFTHVRDNLRGDVSGKRFNAHATERNMADVAKERLNDGTRGLVTGQRHSSI